MAMQYRWRDVPGMLRTPGGRRQVAGGILFRAWPLLSRLARLHRRTAARRARVVAVVGSFGKSTTARAVAAALGMPEHPALTHNAWSSVARAVLRIRPWQRHAVIEAGISGPGQMPVYARMIRPDVTVVTSIGSEHHPAMPTLDVTRSEKAKMIEALPATGLAVLNGDDANVAWMALRAPCRVVTFGFGARCDVRASDLRLDWPRGMRFRVDAFGEARDASIRILGRQMVYPALAAIAVAVCEGVALDDAIARVGALPPTPGRMEAVALPDGAWVLRDDYKGTRETFEAALDLLDETPRDGRSRCSAISPRWRAASGACTSGWECGRRESCRGSSRWAAASAATGRVPARPASRARRSSMAAAPSRKPRRASAACSSPATSC